MITPHKIKYNQQITISSSITVILCQKPVFLLDRVWCVQFGINNSAMNKYQVLQKVGSGNFSAVHLVRNVETGQTAAMKLMKTHQKIALKQAYFLKNFDHPNIVRLLDFEQDATKGETRIVLEYLPENTLQLYEQQQFGLRQEQVKCVLFQTALGLAYVHERGIIHRDIKPQNILIDKRKAEIKLIDFGLAVSLQKVATDYVATRWYRAPENLLGTKEYSCLIDVFSLACVIVELYLGNPLFPGADNLDQLYRIFNILGEPTDNSWPAGARKFKELGFKSDPSKTKKAEDSFGLRSLLKACSQGLVNLLEKMLVLNPKKRITTKEIVIDPYFADVKTIIPPAIYKRFEKDHLLKKTTSKEVIENAESFINQTRSKLSRINTGKQETHQNSILSPNLQETNDNNCTFINMALSPRKNTIPEEDQRAREEIKKVQLQALSPKQPSLASLRPPHENIPAQPSILAFRGFNPIKNNKISVKETRKNQQSHSQHKASRENSLDSMKGRSKDKLISNSIDLGRKILNNSGRLPDQVIKIQRRITNERDYRTPDHKEKSLDRNRKVLYYFQGEKEQPKAVTPLKIIMPARQNFPIQASLRIQQKNNSLLASESTRITRNNSAINLPSVRIPAPMPLTNERDRISHSPGISLMQKVEPRRQDFQTHESIYAHSARPTFEKLKLITNVAAPSHTPSYLQQQFKNRSDRSQDHSTLNISALQSAQGSVLRGERMLQFKEKIIVNGNRQMIPANNYLQRPQLIEQPTQKPLPSASISKLKHYKSADKTQPQVQRQADKKEPFSMGQFKTLLIDDRHQYREPRISTKKEMSKLTQFVTSPRQNNININLNVSIIDDQPQVAGQAKRSRI